MHQIVISGIEMEVTRKNVKHLRLTLYPSERQIRITVPFKVNDEAVQRFVTSKLPWIKKHQSQWKGQSKAAEPEYMTGESHYYAGQSYQLNVIDATSGLERVVMRNDENTLDLQVRSGSHFTIRERVIFEWYRQQMIRQVESLIPKWEAVIGVKVHEFRIRRMKTRWGTCNIKAHRIWLNLELVKKPIDCLEYVLVHEMVHLLERYHNARFHALMDRFMPQWRNHRATLNQPLFSE